ncbi:putative signal transduction histidine-protein kinase [Podospora conica]|nr:putative signal transduction histidine-protein kinase [Schizothecium conicum]
MDATENELPNDLRVPHDSALDETHDVPTPGEQSTSAADSAYHRADSPTPASSWSTASDRQLGHNSQNDPSDRVFPIRSVVSVEPNWSTPNLKDRRGLSLSDGSGVPPPATHSTRLSPPAPPILSLDESRRPGAKSTDDATPTMRPPPPRPQQYDKLRGTLRRPPTGARSSVQADADRMGMGTPVSLALEAMSSDEDESASFLDFSSRGGAECSTGRQSPVDQLPDALLTQRFKHVMTNEGHAVITGRDGKMERCEDEPIHTPGAIQGFGLLIAIHEEPDGRFQVRYVSENSKRLIGYSPRALFRLGDFLDILSDEQAENLLDHIDFIRDEDADPAVNGPEVFSLSIKPRGKAKPVKLWCAIHMPPGDSETVICEFEMDDDEIYPLRPPDEEIAPDFPEDTLHSNPTTEELTESTEILSRPLRVLRRARKKRGEAGAMQVFDIMSQVQEQLANAPNLDRFLKILIGIVKELTGFHRVMIYQFDSYFNGKVVKELVDPAYTRDLFHGLHFPATDIPKQARELYKINKVRLLYDRDLESARIVCRSVQDLETPLDMTHCYLRAMSPIHIKYLANMAVRSSMSISINAFGDLWGLLACHSYGPKGMRVSFPIRKMCRLVGDTASRNIERLSYASRLQARKLINTVPTDKNPSGYIIASSDDLLKLFDADFGLLSIREETKMLGKIEQSQEALAMLEYLRLRKFTSVVMTQDVRLEFPDLRYPPGFSVIAGLLYVPLSVGGSDFIVFFRRGQIRDVRWAGNPYEKIIQEGTEAVLEPRKSFKVWHETVIGKSREWSEEQVETAAVLCLVYGKFIEVWRQKEAALQNSRLTRLLLANSAHEVRTPLNAIINYLEIALEGSLDQETRDNLSRSHSASKSLICVINDLLDLTKTEEGQELIKGEIFDLPACIREGSDPFKTDAARKGIAYEFVEQPGLPQFVYGDQRRVRQVVANITANAVQHTAEGRVRIELYVAEVLERRVWIEIVVEDTGSGMTDEKLDALFRDLEQVSTDESDNVLDNKEGTNDTTSEGKRTLGLGLAVVARILRNMDGQLRLKSEPGKGSRFVVQLPFDLPSEDKAATEKQADSPTADSDSGTAMISVAPAKSQDGELLLVDRSSSVAPASGHDPVHGPHSRHMSASQKNHEETRSVSSHRSNASRVSGKSSMSDAERLIDAIQMPLALGEPESESIARQRRNSRAPYYHPSSSSATQQKTSRSISPSGRKARPDGPLRSGSTPNRNMNELVPYSPTGGVQYVTDTKVPIKPVKMPDEATDQVAPPVQSSSRVLFELADVQETVAPSDGPKPAPAPKAKLHVLVAEDDPINVKVLRKRLEKAGHTVTHAVNGEDCAALYRETPDKFDVVLMDMQMPIVDGLTSTKMIRAFEQQQQGAALSPVAGPHGRIPVMAVSASLVEHKKDTYVGAGFDAWILKPINFARLETLLRGLVDDGVRDEALYVPGEWERGGWFAPRADGGGEGGPGGVEVVKGEEGLGPGTETPVGPVTGTVAGPVTGTVAGPGTEIPVDSLGLPGITDTETGTKTELGVETGTESGTGTGTETVPETKTGLGVEMGAQAGPGTETGEAQPAAAVTTETQGAQPFEMG